VRYLLFALLLTGCATGGMADRCAAIADPMTEMHCYRMAEQDRAEELRMLDLQTEEAAAAQISVGVSITQSVQYIARLTSPRGDADTWSEVHEAPVAVTQWVAGPLKRSFIEPLLNPTEPDTVPKPV
jgi:hypothetical protein